MWAIKEHRGVQKNCQKLPSPIVKKYELWKQIIFRHGPDKLREFKGFHDEKLIGGLQGKRSSRLSLQYRVLYSVQRRAVTVYVLEISPHKY